MTGLVGSEVTSSLLQAHQSASYQWYHDIYLSNGSVQKQLGKIDLIISFAHTVRTSELDGLERKIYFHHLINDVLWSF